MAICDALRAEVHRIDEAVWAEGFQGKASGSFAAFVDAYKGKAAGG